MRGARRTIVAGMWGKRLGGLMTLKKGGVYDARKKKRCRGKQRRGFYRLEKKGLLISRKGEKGPQTH